MKKETGWRPIPLPLKILFVVFVLWAIGSAFAIPTRYEMGLPLFGVFVYGIFASLVILLLDFAAPVIFLFALWNRKSWGALFGIFYNAIFILNSAVAIFTAREQLGLMPILIPTIASIIFVTLIYSKRSYFK